MNRPFVQENARQRERLVALAARLTDEDLLTPLGGGWTIAAGLAHLAFWDQRCLILTLRWKPDGPAHIEDADYDTTNDALLPLCLALAPRAAANLAVSSAEAVDRAMEAASDACIAALEEYGATYRMYRSEHRKSHLDEIEAFLKAKTAG